MLTRRLTPGPASPNPRSEHGGFLHILGRNFYNAEYPRHATCCINKGYLRHTAGVGFLDNGRQGPEFSGGVRLESNDKSGVDWSDEL
jgi:hypothetical protein